MRIHRYVLSLGTLLLPLIAVAHTHLVSSVPAADSHGAAPTGVQLEFAAPVRLTQLGILIPGAGEPKSMGALPPKAAKAFTLPAPKLAPGNYQILWRAVGDDGHVVQGKIGFQVTAP